MVFTMQTNHYPFPTILQTFFCPNSSENPHLHERRMQTFKQAMFSLNSMDEIVANDLITKVVFFL